jgi:hypothetical protein
MPFSLRLRNARRDDNEAAFAVNEPSVEVSVHGVLIALGTLALIVVVALMMWLFDWF